MPLNEENSYHVYIGHEGELFIVLNMYNEGYDGILYNAKTGFSYVSLLGTNVQCSIVVKDISTASEEELFQFNTASNIPYSAEFIQKVQMHLKNTSTNEIRKDDYKVCIK